MQIKQILFKEQHLPSLVLKEEMTTKQRAEFLRAGAEQGAALQPSAEISPGAL